MAEAVKDGIQPKAVSFEWTIKRFFAGCENVGDCHASPIIPIHYSGEDTKWFLKIFPKGDSAKNQENISLYLNFQSENVSKVTVGCQLSIVSEKYRLSRKFIAKTLKGPKANWGWFAFVKQDVIKDVKNGVLIDDTLTISCKITFNQEKDFCGYNKWLDKMQEGLKEYEKLVESNCFSDVTFTMQGKEIHLHKAILSCRNSVFGAMFEHEMKETKESLVKITDIDYDVMKELFRFIYTGKVQNIGKLAKDLLIAADKYGVTELKALCEKTLYDNLNCSNAIEYLQLTEVCDTLHLKKLVIKFVVNNLTDIVSKSSFKLAFADFDRDLIYEIMEAVADKD